MNNEEQEQQEAQLKSQTSQFSLVVLALLLLILASTTFFRFIEDWSWLDSYYFTIVTIATVGYGDLTPTTDIGKFGATVVIILGIGLFSTFASMLLKRRALKGIRKKIKKEIEHLD